MENEFSQSNNIIYNRQPCGPNFDNSQQCNLTSEYSLSTPGAGQWHIYNVTNMVNSEYSNNDNNVSIALKDTSGQSYQQVYYNSKEHSNITTRPYLNITYSGGTHSSQEWDLSYDDKGNLRQGIDKYYEYNNFNQLIAVYDGDGNGDLLEEYVYDHKGNRIKKIEYLSGGGNNTFYYIGDDFVRKVNSSGSFDTVYYYDGYTLLAKNESGTMYFFHPDHLGSNDLMTDINGNVVEETFYYPFGLILSGGNKENRLFTGKELDSTDLYYYGARYYDPFMRRFTQADPVIADIYNPQSLNAYSYVLNNPYGYVDPDGENPIAILAGIWIGTRALYGGLSAGIDEYLTQLNAGGTMDLYRLNTQVLKGLGKGAVVGTVEAGIVVASVLINPLAVVLGASTALTVGEGIIEPAWDISSAKTVNAYSNPPITTVIPNIQTFEIYEIDSSSRSLSPAIEKQIANDYDFFRSQIQGINRNIRGVKKGLSEVKDIKSEFKEVYGSEWNKYWKESGLKKIEKDLKKAEKKLKKEKKKLRRERYS